MEELLRTLSIVPMQLILAAGAVFGIEYLKHAKWFPAVVEGKPTLNRWFSVAVAAAAATGIAVSSTWDAAAGTLQFTITGLTMGSVYKGLWGFASQWIMQYGTWKLFKDKLQDKVTVNLGSVSTKIIAKAITDNINED